MSANLDKLWFSQASLSAWLNCPLKFRYRYIDGLYWPVTTGESVSAHIELGRRFHLLAQRYFVSGETRVPPGEDSVLGHWLHRLKEYLPLTGARRFLPEYELRSARDGLRLLAKYDLLAAGADGVTIYDWKTDERAPSSRQSASPQSRLYLYLLSLSDYFVVNPDSMQMVYWNPRFPQEPLSIRYSLKQQEQDGLWIKEMIVQIQNSAAFPATSNDKNCRFCEYRPVCHGKGLEEIEEASIDWDEVDWEQIEEIAVQGVNLL